MQLARVVDDAALGDDPVAAAISQTQLCFWLITMRRPEPDRAGNGAYVAPRAVEANSRVRVAGLTEPGLRQAVPGLEPEDG